MNENRRKILFLDLLPLRRIFCKIFLHEREFRKIFLMLMLQEQEFHKIFQDFAGFSSCRRITQHLARFFCRIPQDFYIHTARFYSKTRTTTLQDFFQDFSRFSTTILQDFLRFLRFFYYQSQDFGSYRKHRPPCSQTRSGLSSVI